MYEPFLLPVSRGTGHNQQAGAAGLQGPRCFCGHQQVLVASVPLPCQGTGQELHGPPGHWPVTRKHSCGKNTTIYKTGSIKLLETLDGMG